MSEISSTDKFDEIPEEFLCPITLDIMEDPVICEDGYTYEREAIISISNSLSPMTRQPINKRILIPNRALKQSIEKFTSKFPKLLTQESKQVKKITKPDYINMNKEQYDKLSQENLNECYTEFVNVLSEYVMRMNAIDVKRSEVIKILKQRSSEELEKQNAIGAKRNKVIKIIKQRSSEEIERQNVSDDN